MNAHGDISFEWIDDLLILHARGPFNEVGISNSITEIRTSVIDKNIKLWRKLEVWDEETLGSPLVISLAEEGSQWYQNNGCFASAIVICNSIQQHIVEKITHNITQVFYDKEEAMKWLNEQHHYLL